MKLVLLPGLDGTGRFFARLQRSLASTIPVQVVRYPADARLGYGELPDYVRAQIGDGPAVLLGESFSGPIATKLAAANPQRVKGLILAATFVKSPWPPWMIGLSAIAKPSSVPRSWIDAVLCGGSDDRELAAEIADMMAGFAPEVRSARLRAVAGVNVLDDLQRVSCPILVLHGNQDWLVWKSGIVKAVASKPGACVKLLEGPHMLLQRNASGAARELEKFFEMIDGPK